MTVSCRFFIYSISGGKRKMGYATKHDATQRANYHFATRSILTTKNNRKCQIICIFLVSFIYHWRIQFLFFGFFFLSFIRRLCRVEHISFISYVVYFAKCRPYPVNRMRCFIGRRKKFSYCCFDAHFMHICEYSHYTFTQSKASLSPHPHPPVPHLREYANIYNPLYTLSQTQTIRFRRSLI